MNIDSVRFPTGIINFCKPPQMTSRELVDRVEQRYPDWKVGHGGTLDRAARGVLPVLVNEATKLVPYLQREKKTYQAKIRFDRVSPSYDLDRERKMIDPGPSPSREEICRQLEEFQGVISQTPPIYSAVWTGGVRSYRRAEKGEEINLDSRTVHVYDIQLLEMDFPSLTVEIKCGKGFYVRSLVRDLANKLDREGAILSELLRTRYGGLNLEQSVDVSAEDWGTGWISPGDAFLETPIIHPDPELIEIICHGGWVPRKKENHERAIVQDQNGRVRALVEAENKQGRTVWQPRRVLNLPQMIAQ